MLVSMSWLREFVPYQGKTEVLGDKLTMMGLELENIIKPFSDLEPIVVGLVVSCEKHPEADKLSVCKVDVGSEVLDIVCGAPNVAKGQKVAVIPSGNKLPNGTLIKASKLRGCPSNGMICSEFELNLSLESDGIMVLDDSVAVGSKLVDVLGLDDEVMDISITPNRGDCLSILGVAREVALAYDLPLSLPALKSSLSSSDALTDVKINVESGDVCHLYLGKIINNVQVGPSPFWLRRKILAVGLRSISNIVDVTNYILMELGQPLHSFDLDKLSGNQINVLRAKDGQKIVTLDGETRSLLSSDVVICDEKNPIALAGVMGGLDSEIDANSRNVFLEAAVFNPLLVRKTAHRLSLQTDSSYRFERGIDQLNTSYALHRASELLAECSGGIVKAGVARSEMRPWVAPKFSVRKKRAEELIGIDFSKDFCEKTMRNIGCSYDLTSSEDSFESSVWEVIPPSHRLDITREVDIIEELVRVHGVDLVPPTIPGIVLSLESADKKEPRHMFRERLKSWSAGIGLNEVINYSFVSHSELDSLGFSQEGRVDVLNPLSDEQNVLRPLLLPGLLHNLRTNISQGATGIRLFEVACGFEVDKSFDTGIKETQKIGFLLYGQRYDKSWGHGQVEHDYYDLKGIIESLFGFLYLKDFKYMLSESSHCFAPLVNIYHEETLVGYIAKVKPSIADNYHAKKSTWVAELNSDVLYDLHLLAKPLYSPLPIFPAVRRDITFIAPMGLNFDLLEHAIKGSGARFLEQVVFLDSFTPEGSNERHLTVRITFRSLEKTLKDNEVDKQRDAIVSGVLKEFSSVRV